MEFDYEELTDAPERQELLALYSAVGWSVYTEDPERLERALANSTYVLTARANSQLVGLARVLSDDVSIMYLQDILVMPNYQRMGLGRGLLERLAQRFSHVRQKVLLTDDRDAQKRFYESLGYHNVAELEEIRLNAFVKIEGVELA